MILNSSHKKNDNLQERICKAFEKVESHKFKSRLFRKDELEDLSKELEDITHTLFESLKKSEP